MSGKILSEFVGLICKVYACLKDGGDDNQAKKKLKCIKTNI